MEHVPFALSGLAIELIGRVCAVTEGRGSERELRSLPEVQAVLEAAAPARRECVLALAWSLITELPWGHPWEQHQRSLLSLIARKAAPLTLDDLEALVAGAERADPIVADMAMTALTGQFRDLYSRAAAPETAMLIERASHLCHYKADRTRLAGIVVRAPTGDPWALIDDRDDVGPRLRAALARSGEAPEALLELLKAFPASGQPSHRWIERSQQVALSGQLATELIEAVLAAGDVELEERYGDRDYRRVRFLAGDNEALTCALVAFIGGLRLASLLGDLRRLAAKAITGPNGWERSLRLANACVRAIGEAGTDAALRELVALERTTTHGSLRREIANAVDAIARERGMSRARLLETAVESHGLDADGVATLTLPGGVATITVEDLTARVAFTGPGGRRRRTFPADVPEEAVAAVRAHAKAIRGTLAVERTRLDGLLAVHPSWTLDEWTRHYLEHPITGHLTRRLIWRFTFADRELLGLAGDALTAHTADGARVSVAQAEAVALWHPLDSPRDVLMDWRRRLLADLVVQPVRQAFRECYLVSAAEERAGGHSNRFAGHVFRQTQARALMKRRGWQPVPAAWWDDGIEHAVARRVFEPDGVRVEFFFDPVEDIDPDPSGVHRYCTSDQVRFFRGRTDEPLDLADIPPVVFSEALRDVDLFVSVTSIGADPDWHARAEGRRFHRYWDAFNFGPLDAAGDLRRQVLAELLPRLAIQDRCELGEPYLVVKGQLRTYRIHLGRGHVLLSPDNRRLTLASLPGRRAAQLYLPVDDDPVLVRVLAAALTLADDAKITDERVLRQLAGPA